MHRCSHPVLHRGDMEFWVQSVCDAISSITTLLLSVLKQPSLQPSGGRCFSQGFFCRGQALSTGLRSHSCVVCITVSVDSQAASHLRQIGKLSRLSQIEGPVSNSSPFLAAFHSSSHSLCSFGSSCANMAAGREKHTTSTS